MGKLTASERADLEAKLAADDDDDDDEVEIGMGEGKYFRGSYRRARALGYVNDPRDKKDDDGADGKDTAKRFTSGRRTG